MPINQSKVLTEPHTGEGEVTSQHRQRLIRASITLVSLWMKSTPEVALRRSPGFCGGRRAKLGLTLCQDL